MKIDEVKLQKQSLNDYTIYELLSLYANILERLQEMNIVRVSSIVGEFAEWIVAKTMDLRLTNTSNKSFDAVDSSGLMEVSAAFSKS